LSEYYVDGIRTNIPFFDQVLADPRFREGDLDTGFIEDFFRRRKFQPGLNAEQEAVAALVAAVHAQRQRPQATAPAAAASRWRVSGRERLYR
jgi:acetyl/propionyl-CoA carboxylase alpha subunit